ncbi:hypothetical protein [Gordonia sp. OPL2]|uniref:hypothetical protein n=1 Tax=Gordonia sp. OPL2 TaxID=2486274 RepID=UPI0016560CD6|nr:hypothetical protein [Gordonia sp. OPL2]RPA19866.1 hypothetical protein EEB19_02140 [Gordonia sp. OPL2]
MSGGLPRIHRELTQAYRYLSVEWVAYADMVSARDAEYATELDALAAAGRGPGDADFDAVVTQKLDNSTLYRMLCGNVMHSATAVEVLNDLTPVWVPEAVNDALASIEVPPGDARSLTGIGASGLLVFGTSPIRARESLPGGQTMPEVDVDGVLWWTKTACHGSASNALAEGVPRRLMLAPLTRSRDLQWLRGDGWRTSTLTEVTCFDVTTVRGVDVQEALWPCVELLARIGTALQHNSLRCIGGSITMLDAA